jgi:2'-5' RNA ligase
MVLNKAIASSNPASLPRGARFFSAVPRPHSQSGMPLACAANPSAAAPTLRLFLGLWPTPAQRAALQSHADTWHWPAAARRTNAERLHFTLHFLGNVAIERVAALRTALALPWEGCELVLDQAQVWPGGIAVLEASRVPPALAALHARLRGQLEAQGVPVESRRYRPHLTLARRAAGARPPADWQPLQWTLAPRYALVQSLPGGGGYLPLQCFG